MTEVALGTEFCLLGPLVVRHWGAPVPVSPGKQRAVLACLLLSANRVASHTEIAEVLWGPEPPPSAPVTIRNYVRRLRRALEVTGHARIGSVPRGYLIRVAAGELDVARFEALAEAAGAAARGGQWGEAAASAHAALALWRGEPLENVESDVLARQEVPRLAEMRLQVLQTRIDADLQLGRHADVVAELGRLAAANPLLEHLHAQLMLALYRCGRQADALATYLRVRQALVEEIGTEPGPELREMHRRILTADPSVAASRLAAPLPDGIALSGRPLCPIVPRELPPAAPQFTGRHSELATLTRLITQQENTPGTAVIPVIGGTAGVGKTALAVHWAHQAAGSFPDGQLYVNLHGCDRGQPVHPAAALAGFLRAFGVPGQEIPDVPDERAVRYRSLVAGRRILVMLDNAASAEQVRPLLPGTATCVTLVTSRNPLAGLMASDGARRLELAALPAPEAVSLLRTLIGDRMDAEPGAAATLAGLCRGLPAALRMAAELAVARPAGSLTSLAAELAGIQLGRPDEYISELESLVMQHPAGERLHAQLMRIPWHHGWQAQAPEMRPAPAAEAADSTLRPGPGLADAWTAVAQGVNALPVTGHVEFLAGLHRRFHDRLLDCILMAAGHLQPGRERVITGTFAYLDACRWESGLRSLLASARAESAVRAEIAERNDQLSELIAPDFAEAGRARPAHAARIWVAMAAEVALAESAAGAELPDLRAALIEFLGPEL